MNLLKSQHYTHLKLCNERGIYHPQPYLIVGSSGTGKSNLGEDIIEELEESYNKNIISFFLVDAMDTIESGFSIFPATNREQLQQLAYQRERPEAKPNTKFWIIYGNGFKDLQKQHKKLPEFEVITFSAKSILQRQECLFLTENTKENQSVRLLMKLGELLKKDEDLRFTKKYVDDLTKRKKEYLMGRYIDSDDEPIADKKALGDIIGALDIFNYDNCVMPDNFSLNFNAKKLLEQKGTRHVFIYRCLKKDDKLRDFIFFHILNEIARNITDCKYPVNIVIEETQTKAPYKGQGYKEVLSEKMGDLVGLLRKTGRGVSIFMLGRVWNRIAEQVRTECSKQIIFHLEQDDMLKFVKVRNLGKKAKEAIENLKIGECVLRGFETKIIQSKVPKHGHKHTSVDFFEEYKKFYPERMKDYSETIEMISETEKELKKRYELLIKEKRQELIATIKKQEGRKARVEKDKEKIKELEAESKQKKGVEKKKRDQEIINVYNELKQKGDKISYRVIAELVNDKGIKVSYVTVKNVLDTFDTIGKDNENSVSSP